MFRCAEREKSLTKISLYFETHFFCKSGSDILRQVLRGL